MENNRAVNTLSGEDIIKFLILKKRINDNLYKALNNIILKRKLIRY